MNSTAQKNRINFSVNKLNYKNLSAECLCCVLYFINLLSFDECFAVASADDTIKPYVSSSLDYESNFFRIGNNELARDRGLSSREEFIKKVTAGFDSDWQLGRQHFLISGSANQNWFQNNQGLDYTGWNTAATWKWQLLSDLKGQLGYTNFENLGSFTNLNRYIANLSNTQTFFGNASYLFHPNGQIRIGYNRLELAYDNASRKNGDLTQNTYDVNLEYLSQKDYILGLHFSQTDGLYPNRPYSSNINQNPFHLDSGFTRNVYEVTWNWKPETNKIAVDGALGYNEQNFPHVSARNFGSMAGQLNVHYLYSEKTSIDLILQRLITQSFNTNSSFLQLQSIELNPKWIPTPKVTIGLPLRYYQQSYLGETGGDLGNLPQQVNYTRSIGINLQYLPVDYVSITPSIMYEKRNSNYNYFPGSANYINSGYRSYDSFSFNLNLQVLF